MFCTDIPNTVMVNAVGTALLRDNMVTGKKFATLTADYVFGHDLLRAAKTFFDAHGAQHVSDELIATDVTDFSPYLLKVRQAQPDIVCLNLAGNQVTNFRSEEHTSELQSLMRISYAVFCLKKTKNLTR